MTPPTTEPHPIEASKPFMLPLTVRPPFGADHIVAVATPEKLDKLNAALFRLDGTQSAAKAAHLLAEATKASDGWQSGIQGCSRNPLLPTIPGKTQTSNATWSEACLDVACSKWTNVRMPRCVGAFPTGKREKKSWEEEKQE